MSQEKQHASANAATRRTSSCAVRYLCLAFALCLLLVAFLLHIGIQRLVMNLLGPAVALVGFLSASLASADGTNTTRETLTSLIPRSD